MDVFRKNWFSELSPDDLAALKGEDSGNKKIVLEGQEISPWPGQCFSLQYEEVLFQERSKFQDVLVLKSSTYGNVLVLDNVIQCTERDEFSYQEMLTHLPMFAHPNPKKVLLIGAGDGGILREVLKHEAVESVVMCEIDEMVIDVSKKYLPGMSSCFSNPKFELHIGDGFEFLKTHKNEYDVIITDSSDPVGPAQSLFGEHYFELINLALRDGGILASQCESIWLHLELIKNMVKFNRRIFPTVSYAYASVPTYPSGTIGFLLACKTECDLQTPKRLPTADEQSRFRFYSPEMHRAAFALPYFAKQVSSTESHVF
ncbi:Spermidine synthase [Aphelenchoides besseyi]|nr:Spermidine synthase [Aphelenchoides besseyi]KAI6194319.1 Spermidine synthase [Aphelenchoides besseyi]